MPSTSGRAASYPSRQDKLKFFHELKNLRDRLLLQKGKQSTDSTTTSTDSTTTSTDSTTTSAEFSQLTACT